MPPVKVDTQDDSSKFLKTSSKSGKIKMNRAITAIKTNAPQRAPLSDPTSPQNVLKYYVKHHKQSLEAFKKKSNEISEKMQNTNICVAEKNQENALLKKQ